MVKNSGTLKAGEIQNVRERGKNEIEKVSWEK